MTDRPILFSGDMVRAILAGKKTETRRPISHKHPFEVTNAFTGHHWPYFEPYVADIDTPLPCPFGSAGDRLWVRETWSTMAPYPCVLWEDGASPAVRSADLSEVQLAYWRRRVVYRATQPEVCQPTRWKPSIHMPRWASRITLPVAEVRVEQLQDITEEGALREGLEAREILGRPCSWLSFAELWDGLYGAKEDLSWEANPWVWVVRWGEVTDD
jgi:hypothetical protein